MIVHFLLILLSTLVGPSSQRCTADGTSDCSNEPDLICKTPKVADKSNDRSCDPGYVLHMREHNGIFEPIDGQAYCTPDEHGESYGRRKGGFKLLDIDLTCAKERIVLYIGTKLNPWIEAEKIGCIGTTLDTKVVGGNKPTGHDSIHVRCRKNRPTPTECVVTPYYDAILCDTRGKCTEPVKGTDDKFSCSSGTMQYLTDDWKDGTGYEVKCNANKLISMTKDSIVYDPQMLRCYAPKGCDLANYDSLPCEDDNECVLPKLDQNALKCDKEYELQAKEAAQWTKVDAITCDSNTFKYGNGKDLVAARCVRKNLGKVYDASLCTAEEECKEPTGHSTVSCEDKFNLQVKVAGGDWMEVKSITANSDKFTGKDATDAPLATQPEKIRCVRMGCSTCPNPCASCPSPFTFTPSTKWNECVSFGCGAATRTLIGTERVTDEKVVCHPENKEGESFWKKADGSKITGDVKCEQLCTLKSALISKCEDGEDVCVTTPFNDDDPIKCEDKAYLVRKSSSDEKTRGMELTCNEETGQWNMKQGSGDIVKVEKGENVYCQYENCKSEFCERCETNSEKQLLCPKGLQAKVDRYKADSSRVFTYFTCSKGRWSDDQGNQMEDTDTVTCGDDDSDAEQKEGVGTAQLLLIYVVALLFVLLIIAILLAYIVCRLQGKGWLHTIIANKVRGKKKEGKKGGTKEMKSGKKYPRADSSGKRKNTEKETSNVSNAEPEGPTSSAEPVPARASGEKVSAEGLSVTGASAEKFSQENVGGVNQSGSNEPIPDPLAPPQGPSYA